MCSLSGDKKTKQLFIIVFISIHSVFSDVSSVVIQLRIFICLCSYKFRLFFLFVDVCLSPSTNLLKVSIRFFFFFLSFSLSNPFFFIVRNQPVWWSVCNVNNSKLIPKAERKWRVWKSSDSFFDPNNNNNNDSLSLYFAFFLKQFLSSSLLLTFTVMHYRRFAILKLWFFFRSP